MQVVRFKLNMFVNKGLMSLKRYLVEALPFIWGHKGHGFSRFNRFVIDLIRGDRLLLIKSFQVQLKLSTLKCFKLLFRNYQLGLVFFSGDKKNPTDLTSLN